MHIHEGACTEEKSAQTWGKGQQSPSLSWLKSWRSTSSFHPPHGWGPWFLHNSKIYDDVCPLRRSQDSVSSLNDCFLTAFPLFLHSLVSLKITDYWGLFKGKIKARLRSQNGFGKKKSFLLCQESHAWFSFSKNLSPHPSAYRRSDAF